MLAEKTSNTELALPGDLQKRAYVLSGEYAWTASDALRIVEWLRAHDVAVVGVELWRDHEGSAQWIATSNYSSEDTAACARGAAQFIAEFKQLKSDSGNLFNLTTASKSSFLQLS